MLHPEERGPSARACRRIIGLVLFALLTGRATTDGGPHLGGLMMFNATRCRPATPQECIGGGGRAGLCPPLA